jgi:hypothetical protein
MGKLARYIIRASFSQERMTYLPEASKVIYESKACPRHRSGNAQKEKVFDALEAMSSHVPDKGEQMVRYYGYYSDVCRGKRKRQNQDEWIPCILEPEGSSKEYRKNWARLIQKNWSLSRT